MKEPVENCRFCRELLRSTNKTGVCSKPRCRRRLDAERKGRKQYNLGGR